MSLQRKAVITAVVLLFAVGYLVLRKQGRQDEGTGTHKQEQKVVSVSTLALAPSTVEQSVLATGTLIANEELDLKSEIAGRITQINFQEGKPVSQGQLLIKLNDADLKATLKKLDLQQALAQREETRAKKLLDQKLISLEEYESKLNAVQIVQADIDRTQSDIAKTELRAPFSGVVGLRSVSAGSTIDLATSIAHIQQINPIKIEFSLPEKYSHSIALGSTVRFKVTGSDKEYNAKVYALEPKIDPATRTVKVRATAPNTEGSLTPGAFARVEITLSRNDDALTVPTSAIVPQIEGQSVYVLSGGKAVSKIVTTGIRTDTTVQILTGLLPGDSVVTTGVMQLRQGMHVRSAN
jgi:membrane fusion protein (multidrug efflux system)